MTHILIFHTFRIFFTQTTLQKDLSSNHLVVDVEVVYFDFGGGGEDSNYKLLNYLVPAPRLFQVVISLLVIMNCTVEIVVILVQSPLMLLLES